MRMCRLGTTAASEPRDSWLTQVYLEIATKIVCAGVYVGLSWYLQRYSVCKILLQYPKAPKSFHRHTFTDLA